MCCEHLVCASCAAPVASGGCPVCRSARAQLHPAVQVPYAALALALALLCLVLALATR